MGEYNWIVCKGCGKTGWLDQDEPMNRTGWKGHNVLHGPQDTRLNFYLCSKCDCENCPEAIIMTGYNEDGSKYPDIECKRNEEGCIYLRGSAPSVNEEIEDK